MSVPNSPTALAYLRIEWLKALACYVISSAVSFSVLGATEGLGFALAWLPLGVLAAIVELWLILRSLPLNYRRDEGIMLPSLGPGTWLTVSRGILLALLSGFLIPSTPSGWLAWAPGVIFLFVGITDYLDGYTARITKHMTLLGEQLDTDLDGLGVLITSLLGIKYGQLPVVYLAVGLARYVFVASLGWLKWTGRPIYTLPESADRRFMAGFQMGLIAVILLPIFVPPATTITATLFMIPFIGGFARDWMVVSGALKVDSSLYRGLINLSRRVFHKWLPVGCRLGLVILLVGEALSGKTFGQPTIFVIIEVIAILAISIGVIGRLVALVFLLAIGFMAKTYGLDVWAGVKVMLATSIVLLGSGALSAWQPEESFLRKRAGETRRIGINR